MLPSVGAGSHFGAGERDGITGVAEARQEVGLILALRAVGALRQEIGSAATHEDVGFGGEILLDDAVVFAAPADMCDHGGGGGILDLGIGDDANRHSEAALDQAGDGLDLRIIERIERAVGVDAHGIDRRFMAGGIGAGGVCGIGNDRIAPGGGHQGHMRHVVNGELALRFALRNALGKQARRSPVRRRHAVTDEQDDILCLAWAGVVDAPVDLTGLDPVAHMDFVAAGPCQRHIAQDQSRLILAVLAFDEICGLAERRGIVLAIDQDRDLAWISKAGKFDFEIEPCAGQNLSAVDRVDRLCRGRRSGNRNGKADGRDKKSMHVPGPFIGRRPDLFGVYDNWVAIL
jgi:hypothetical protein